MNAQLLYSQVFTLCLVASPAFALDNSQMPSGAVPFVKEAPDQPQQLGPLWGDRTTGPAGTLLKVPAGWRAPIHAHSADYRGIVIEGHWKHWVPETGKGEGADMPTGSYWTQKAKQFHADACVSDVECVVLLINDEPYETYLPK